MFLSDTNGTKELEYRLSIHKTQYDHLISFMKTLDGWKEQKQETTLNIIMGRNIRLMIQGNPQIESFCVRDFIPAEDWDHVWIGTKVVDKRNTIRNSNGSVISLSEEKEEQFPTLILSPSRFTEMSDDVQGIVKESQLGGKNRIDLLMYKKLFRLRQRISFVWNDSVRVDITKVKQNLSERNISDQLVSRTVLTMKEAELHKQPLKYELEVEVLKRDIDSVDKMKSMIQELERALGINENTIKSYVKQAYRSALRLFIESHHEYLSDRGESLPEGSPATVKEAVQRYMGGTRVPYCIPKLVSMTRENLPIPIGMAITDKADGDSCIVLVFQKEAYVFDSGFRQLAPPRPLEGYEATTMSMFAGEFLSKDKSGLPHSTAYLYDCYMWNGTDVRRMNLVSDKEDESTRIGYVNMLVDMLKEGEPPIGDGLRVRAKKMILGDPREVSMEIWKHKHRYPYVLDGIIFTPAFTPVGQTTENPWEWGYRMNRTWKTHFKWKPPEYNSVDFLLVWKTGITKGVSGLVRKGELRTTETVECNGVRCTVFPLFQPSEYSRPKPYSVEVPIDVSREPKTEDDYEYIRNQSIVECRYDVKQEKWIVLRNRHDKTLAWDASLQTLHSVASKLRILVSLANKGGRSAISQWQHTVLQMIRLKDDRHMTERKSKIFSLLRADLVRFLVFHQMLDSVDVEDREIVRVCQTHRDKLMEMLEEPFVPIPLNFSVSASNHTFVANTIWKSIHEPIQMTDFGGMIESASGAGEDVPPSTTGRRLMTIPMKEDVNQALAELCERILQKESDPLKCLEVSDRDQSLVHGGMIWTSKVSLRKTPEMIRGDVRRFRQGWFNKDDRKSWVDWNESTGGSTQCLLVGIPGSLESVKQRKGLVESVSKSVVVGGRLYVIYWDHSKIAGEFKKINDWKVLGDNTQGMRMRGGHLSLKKGDQEMKFYAWPEDTFLREYTDNGWKPLEDAGSLTQEFNEVAQRDPMSAFLSLLVLERV